MLFHDLQKFPIYIEVTYMSISEGSPICSIVRAHTNLELKKYTKTLYYARFAPFLFNAPLKFKLLNLAPPIFGLTLCDWFISIYMSFFLIGIYIFFYFCVYGLRPSFQEHGADVKKALVYTRKTSCISSQSEDVCSLTAD